MSLIGLLFGCAPKRHDPAVRGLPLDDRDAPFSAVWVGHATVLMRFGRTTLLADPNLSGAILIYPRLTPPSVQPNELPPIDVVTLSHLHVDHFDLRTVRALGRRPQVVYPFGGGPYMDSVHQRKLVAKAWEPIELRGLKITPVPVAHAGGRFAVDAFWNKAYTGYIIEGAGRTIFFAGDTGYHPDLFKAIAKRFPRIDVAFIPIAPARGGNKNHASPEEAVQIFVDSGARLFVPIHYEAYYSSLVPYEEPRERLEADVKKRGLQDRVFALRTGERLVMPAGDQKPWVSNELPRGQPEPPPVQPPPAKPATPKGPAAVIESVKQTFPD